MSRTRRLVRVRGVVQGVGFRPFVYRLATDLDLAGEVGNDGDGVFADVEGEPGQVQAFLDRLCRDSPVLAQVDEVTAAEAPVRDAAGFHIVATRGGTATTVPLPVDTGPCDDCVAELDDPSDRRYRHPFINCTNCGPRYTIIRSLPYDRPTTTMAGFLMCRACASEYADPGDRRFHAQPVACPDCGPRTTLLDPDATVLARDEDALQGTVQRLRDGAIVAVKGVGGYHLACDATSAIAVGELRRRKSRDDKPFAILVSDIAAAARLAHLGPAATAALASPARPIVLAPRREDADVDAAVAPGLVDVGLMLPPSPLHVLIARGVGRPLVLTSANLAHEPMVHDDAVAMATVAPLVDALLVHDRPIAVRCDDSVFRQVDDGGLAAIRRSRGHAPRRIPVPSSHDVTLAVGGHLKNTVTLVRGGEAVISQHVGDLDHPAALGAFHQAIDHLLAALDVTPTLVAHDLHPGYASTHAAQALGLPTVAVQHHHAHVAATLAEHGRRGPVLGIAFDGLGLGPEGGLWGGEFLVADLDSSRRVGHLVDVPQPGGDAAAREPWRMALAWLEASMGRARAEEEARRLDAEGLDARGLDVLAVSRAAITPTTSSVGRLFDAVAALLGVCHTNTYEGQAAVRLEAAAEMATSRADPDRDLPDGVVDVDGPVATLDARPLVSTIVQARDRGEGPSVVAARFHRDLARATAELACVLAARADLSTVVLGGGVFQNRLLTGQVTQRLRRSGLEVLVPRMVPCNDGGLSLGQAVVAGAAASGR